LGFFLFLWLYGGFSASTFYPLHSPHAGCLPYNLFMTCAWCGSVFAARADARFCSGACRVAAHRAEPPGELRELHRWIRHEAKVPKRLNGLNASTTDERSWVSYDSARASSVGDGVGFVFAGDGIAGIDLDHCVKDGRLSSWASRIVKACRGTYVEISPSGSGLHIYGFGVVGAGRKSAGVEVYDRGRYFTCTMRRWKRAPLTLTNIQSVIDCLV
jgi:hypothetical protein